MHGETVKTVKLKYLINFLTPSPAICLSKDEDPNLNTHDVITCCLVGVISWRKVGMNEVMEEWRLVEGKTEETPRKNLPQWQFFST